MTNSSSPLRPFYTSLGDDDPNFRRFATLAEAEAHAKDLSTAGRFPVKVCLDYYRHICTYTNGRMTFCDLAALED